MLLGLDDDALLEVLRAAKDAKVLVALTLSCRKLSLLARSRLAERLRVLDKRHAGFITYAAVRGMPFSGCKALEITASNRDAFLAAARVLRAAQQWPGLQQLSLSILPAYMSLWDVYGLDLLLEDPLPHLQGFHLVMSAEMFSKAQPTKLLLQVTSLWLTPYTANNMSVLPAMGNLQSLELGDKPPSVAPAAGVTGPFLLPSSLKKLAIDCQHCQAPDPMASWLTHLPGNPQLQHLELSYAERHHASAHPAAVMQALSQHNHQLRSFSVKNGLRTRTWHAYVGGLAAAAGPGVVEWRPDAALATLDGLESLAAGSMLHVRGQGDWQRLTHLSVCSSLTGVQFHWAPGVQPQQQAGALLAVLKLEGCSLHLDARGVGKLLLACPQLQKAVVDIMEPSAPPPAAAAGPGLAAHPHLQSLVLNGCHNWGDSAAASAQFAALAPVLPDVSLLGIGGWPCSLGNAADLSPLPVLSPCTALVGLLFAAVLPVVDQPTQEQFVAMVAPLQQLRSITAYNMNQMNASVMLMLEILPHLEKVELRGCGVVDASIVEGKVRPGLKLVAS
jgi:hypothetical protein